MIPVVMPEANLVLGAPKDWDEAKDGQCLDLHVIRDKERNTFTSLWKPNLEELNALVEGGSVMLVIMASAHPPVVVAVAKPRPFDNYNENVNPVGGASGATATLTEEAQKVA